MNARCRCLVIAACAACGANIPPQADPLVTRAWWGSPDFISGDISPDGRYLSQVNWASGDLQLVDLRSGKARDLTGQGYTGGYAWTSAFSPDGRRIAVAWYIDSVNAHELRVMGTDSGRFRIVVPPDPDRYYIDPVDWSASSDEILVAVQGKDQTWQLGLVPAEGGPIRTVKALGWQTPGGGHDQAYPDADLSPDGRYVAYDYPPNPTASTRDIFLVPSTGGAETVLVSGPGSDRLLGWLPGGEGILFYSDRNGTPSIWQLRVRAGRANGEPELIHANVPALIPLGFTRDGYAYGVTTESIRVHAAEVDLAGGDNVQMPRAVHDPAWRRSFAADWSPDGRLAFVTHDPLPDPVETLQIASSTGEIVRTIVLTPALHTSNGTLRWATVDRIIFFAYKRGLDGIFALNLRDGSHRRVMTPPSVGRNAIKWFDVGPDGRSLYMIARPERRSRGNNLVVVDSETGVMRVIGTARAVTASLSVSPDGTQLAFLARNDSSARVELRVIATADSGISRTVYGPDRGRLAPPVTWMPDGSRLVFKIESGEQASLWSISLHGGEPVRLLADCCAGNHVRIHPDGRRLAFASGTDRGELWILKTPGSAKVQNPRE